MHPKIRLGKKAFNSVRKRLSFLAPKDPVYVFHHIPKCGGTSLNKILDSCFVTINDYRPIGKVCNPDKVALNNLRFLSLLARPF